MDALRRAMNHRRSRHREARIARNLPWFPFTPLAPA